MKDKPNSPGRPRIIKQPSEPDDLAESRRDQFFSEKKSRKPILVLDRDRNDSDDPPYKKERSSPEKKFSRRKDPKDQGAGRKRDFTRDKQSDDRPYPRKKLVLKKRTEDQGTTAERDPVARKPVLRRKKDYTGTGSDRSFGDKKPEFKRRKEHSDSGPERRFEDKKPAFKRRKEHSDSGPERRFEDKKPFRPKKQEEGSSRPGRPYQGRSTSRKGKVAEDLIRLNKYIANAGVCSRREADELIQAGAIRVNGAIITQLGYKISRSDKVQYGDQTLRAEPMVYVLLNKPKGFITTVDDPYERDTVMSLVRNATNLRIYPVGRLDRNTTGLLLLTNDGDLAKKLTHPKHRTEKLYHAFLDKSLTINDMEKIATGIELDDGFIRVDEIDYVAGAETKKEIGITLHSGKNRVVRRIFESLGYTVVKLDRVIFAGLTKKDLPRGKWRYLKQEEITRLKINVPSRH